MMRWKIDAGDLRAITRTRKAVAAEVVPYIAEPSDQFALELITGEILGAEADNGGGNLTVALETANNSVILHVWDSGPPLTLAMDRLRDALVSSLASYIEIEPCRNGNHVIARLNVGLSAEPEHAARIWRLASALVLDRVDQMSERFADLQDEGRNT